MTQARKGSLHFCSCHLITKARIPGGVTAPTNASLCQWKRISWQCIGNDILRKCFLYISLLKPIQYFLTIFADRTTLLWFIDWVDTLGNCAVCYNTVNFIAGLAATPFAWRGLGTNLKLARFLPQLTSLQHF